MAVKPKLAMIPSGYKGQTATPPKLYSVLPSDGTGDFTFDRNLNTATRINKDGLIEMVDADVPRLNYPLIDGIVSGCPSLLLEPNKQNVLQRSEEFDNAYWLNNGVTINANQIISPDGTQNADLLTGVSGGFGVVKFSVWSDTNKVASCFAKKGSSNLFVIKNASSGIGGVTFDLENGTITNEDSGFEGEIENYGNGWFRCTAIDTLGRSGTFSLGVTTASESVYIWGAQLERGYKTSYIPTTSSAATRSAETCNSAGDVNTFNDSEGVLMAEVNFKNNDTEKGISISDGTSSNRVLFYLATNGDLYGYVFNGNGSIPIVSIIDTSFQVNSTSKLAIKYKQNDFALWVNGIEIGTEPSGNTFSGVVLDQLSFTSYGTIANPFYGNVKQVQYFDTALTDLELQQLTTL